MYSSAMILPELPSRRSDALPYRRGGTSPALAVRGERDLPRWTETVCRNYVAVDCDRPSASTLCVDMVKHEIGPTDVFQVWSSAMSYSRSSAAISRDPRDDLQITLIKRRLRI